MKKVLAVVMLAGGVAMWPLTYAVGDETSHYHADQTSRQDTLSRLPVEKEVLFRRTMREAREQAASYRKDLEKARQAVKESLGAPELNEAVLRERMKQVQELREKQRHVMEEAVVKLAKQYTPEERKLLAELIAEPGHRYGRHGYGTAL